MTQITVTTQPVRATVSGGTVTATVPSATAATASVTGGVGPVGPQGPQGIPGNALSDAADVQLAGVTEGDVLRYATGAWRNKPESQLIDGGNY